VAGHSTAVGQLLDRRAVGAGDDQLNEHRTLLQSAKIEPLAGMSHLQRPQYVDRNLRCRRPVMPKASGIGRLPAFGHRYVTIFEHFVRRVAQTRYVRQKRN
jgi:hypothetical protein